MKRGFTNKKVLSVFVTLSVILLLLMLGPVEALILHFTTLDDDIIQGEIINFEIEINIEPGETLDLQTITLLLDGPEDLICRFLPNGTLLNSCPNVQIVQTSSTNYNYGYGYEGYLPGTLKYEVNIDSTSLSPGEYVGRYLITSSTHGMESPEQIIVIRPPESVQSCSVRASGGSAHLGEETFTNRNRLSLYVPSGKATDGRGSFTAQNGDRISYTYDVNGASQIGPNTIRFYTSGELRHRQQVYQETATITLNKATNKVTVDGQILDVNNMAVSFIHC
ncbi:MAG: hypothetical protein KKD18_04875 [Nanoarchaeota archaeon]|nr:hypothetical protein [Nanoarchaeota archaeon]MBU0977724.1 hypothetical protein [Nanoarchaeota archaeon]